MSASHSVSGVDRVKSVAELVADTRREYEAAREAFEIRISNRRRR